MLYYCLDYAKRKTNVGPKQGGAKATQVWVPKGTTLDRKDKGVNI